MKFSRIFANVHDFLTSPLRIGAVEISSTSLKYLLIRGNTIVQASLRLPPGVLEHGALKNRAVFVAALKNLHDQITTKQKPINVILTIPSSLVFAQMFTVPMVAKENLDESIKLNLQMTSPNKIEESYYDYQEVKINKDLGHLDLLGAFTAIEPINTYQSALEEGGFAPVAVEFPGMSLARLIKQRWGGIDLDQRYLLLYLSADGALLCILKNGNLAFNHFTPWHTTADSPAESLDFTQAQEVIKRELQRVLNFYLSRTGKAIEEVILVSPVFNYEIVKLITEELKLKARNLSIAELPKLQPSWFPTLGAALRGLTSRGKDVDISLAAASSQTEYYQERALNFIDLWRNIIVGTLIVIIAAFTLIDVVFRQEQASANERLDASVDPSKNQDGSVVQENIAIFNALLEKIGTAATKEKSWSPVLSLIEDNASAEIALDLISNDQRGKTDGGRKLTVSGRGSSEDAVLKFKNKLATQKEIEAVDLPLSEIRTNKADKVVSFKLLITFKATPK
jgi:Tfp pilus assembly PilM family ATPase